MHVLLELRPAFDGHAGIPQETRLLFRGLCQLPGLEVEGMLQASARYLARGLPAGADAWPVHKRLNRLSRVVVSAEPGRGTRRLEWLRAGLQFGRGLVGEVPLSRFDAEPFKDFVWRSLFAKTLPASDFDRITSAGYRVLQLPWNGMHHGALTLRRVMGRPVYPRVDTRGVDVLIAETPFPGRVSRGTQLVVRYHDAIPLLMPHSIVDREHHQASHYHALRRNVDDGAWFSCVSEATRRDLLRVFPEAEARAVVVPNMVSHHYYPESSGPGRVPDILMTRRNRKLHAKAPAPAEGARPYLLMVSTLEPRKNHLGLLAAWETLRAQGHEDLDLVLVGQLGWDHEPIVRKLEPWIAQGRLLVLEDVPAPELRLLYRHALLTVCPSFGEGFDFSGVEAMRCGGVVAGSDIAVHRDVFGDGAEHFDPYDAEAMAACLARLIEQPARREQLRSQGAQVATRYLPEQVLPQWQQFFNTLQLGATRARTPTP